MTKRNSYFKEKECVFLKIQHLIASKKKLELSFHQDWKFVLKVREIIL